MWGARKKKIGSRNWIVSHDGNVTGPLVHWARLPEEYLFTSLLAVGLISVEGAVFFCFKLHLARWALNTRELDKQHHNINIWTDATASPGTSELKASDDQPCCLVNLFGQFQNVQFLRFVTGDLWLAHYVHILYCQIVSIKRFLLRTVWACHCPVV